MRQPDKAKQALTRAEQETDEIDRSVWLAKAADYAISDRAVLVGGTAVNLHTRQYQPTDVDMCAYLDEDDRQALLDLGFEQIQGDHFIYRFDAGKPMLIEFPDTRVDGEVMALKLDADGDPLTVITRESLVVDRIEQATDGSSLTFNEAVRLCYLVTDVAGWDTVETEIQRRDDLKPQIKLLETYERVRTAALTKRKRAE